MHKPPTFGRRLLFLQRLSAKHGTYFSIKCNIIHYMPVRFGRLHRPGWHAVHTSPNHFGCRLTLGQSAQLGRAFRQRITIIGASATQPAQRSTDIPRLPWRKRTFLLALARLPGQYHHQARGRQRHQRIGG